MIHARRRTNLLLIVLCMLMALLSAYQFFSPLRHVDIPQLESQFRNGAHSNVTVFSLPPMQTFASINARLIFNPQRQPATMDVSKVGSMSGTSLPSMSLFGTLIERHTRIAFLKSPASPFATSARVGDLIEGWTVSSIVADRVILTNNAHRLEISLNSAKPPATPQATAPGPTLPSQIRQPSTVQTKAAEYGQPSAPQPPPEVQDMIKNMIKSQTLSNIDSKDHPKNAQP